MQKEGRGIAYTPHQNITFILLQIYLIKSFQNFVCSVPSLHFLVPIPTFKNVTTYLVSRGTQFGSPLLCFHSLFTLPTGEPFAVISFVICVIQWGDPLQWLPWLFTLPNWDTLFSYFLGYSLNPIGIPFAVTSLVIHLTQSAYPLQ